MLIGTAILAVPTLGYAMGRARAATAAARQIHVQVQTPTLPASGTDANARLAASPRRGEWVVVKSGQDSVRAWVVYPERREGAIPVVAIHDNQGLSNWIRGVADQLAAEGFIGIAPDLLTNMDVARRPDGESDPAAVRTVLGQLDQATRDRLIAAIGTWGTKRAGARTKYGIVGFCWGGGTVFGHAVAAPENLGAVVVYYGSSPPAAQLSTVRAPILGLYARNDERVNATIPAADSTLKAMGRSYEYHFFDGAGHGFLRNQAGGENGGNLEASKRAWPMTVEFFRTQLTR
jgi:carboxymethylenebutenolidase